MIGGSATAPVTASHTQPSYTAGVKRAVIHAGDATRPTQARMAVKIQANLKIHPSNPQT
jgi:hypothetical protein